MRITILGIGALGCLFGARLSRHADVTLIGHWPEQIDALRAGLRYVHPDGHEDVIPLDVACGTDGVAPCDAALILTKASQIETSAREAAQMLKPDGVAITLQNGLGNRDVLAAAVGDERAAQGVTLQAASLRGPGVMVYGGEGPTHLAERFPGDPVIRDVGALLERAGCETHVVADVGALLWAKLVVNASINPLTAVLRVQNGVLLDSAWAHDLMVEAAREVAAVAAAQGVALPFADAGVYAERAAEMAALNRSSMLQDVLRGAATEIEMINGAVMRLGAASGVETPAVRTLYRLVKALEDTAQRRIR
ncbi:ketopantoate reductase family protein [Aggregatilinea lenta]|uniref:ketopantoate reductase family protein n=1 Tax=Aggregatilinea lenta TaxID=913108 RepID=UPI000E5A1AA3|nr:2-dehydropantoate 2-reductase [Aggregatilinea lenta]